MDGGKEHTVGLDAHHCPWGQVCDGDQGLADQLFGLIICVDAGKDGAIGAGAVVQSELQELLTLLYGNAVLDLDCPEIGLREGFKVYVRISFMFCSSSAVYTPFSSRLSTLSSNSSSKKAPMRSSPPPR